MALLNLAERWRLEEAQPDEEPNTDQDDAQQEWDTPAPGEELLLGEERRHAEEDPIREEKSRRHPHLGPTSVVASPVLRSILHGHQSRPTPLATDAEALDYAQQNDQYRGQEPDRLERGQRADQERRYTHHV